MCELEGDGYLLPVSFINIPLVMGLGMMRGNTAFGLPLVFNSTQGKSTTGVHIPYVPIFANYKPHYTQSLASFWLGTPASCYLGAEAGALEAKEQWSTGVQPYFP